MSNEIIYNTIEENQKDIANVIDNTAAAFENTGEKAGNFVSKKVVQIGGGIALGAGVAVAAYKIGQKVYKKNKEWFDRKRVAKCNKRYIKLKAKVSPEIMDEYFTETIE